MIIKSVLFSLECTRKRLATGLRPDPLGEIKRSPRPLAVLGGWGPQEGSGRKGMGRERMKGRGGKGREGKGKEGRGGGRERKEEFIPNVH